MAASRSSPHAYSGFLWASFGAALPFPLLLFLLVTTVWLDVLGSAMAGWFLNVPDRDPGWASARTCLWPLVSGNLFSFGFVTGKLLQVLWSLVGWSSLGIVYSASCLFILPPGSCSCGSVGIQLSSLPVSHHSPLPLWFPGMTSSHLGAVNMEQLPRTLENSILPHLSWVFLHFIRYMLWPLLG